MNKLIRILGILLIVLSALLLIATPPVGVIGIIFGVLIIIRSNKKIADKINAGLEKEKQKTEQGTKTLQQQELPEKQNHSLARPDSGFLNSKNTDNDSDPFLMKIDDVFSITGRGTVVTGKIESGSIQLNDKITVITESQKKNTTIAGIEKFNKLVSSAKMGEEVGLLLDKINQNEVKRGYLITKNENAPLLNINPQVSQVIYSEVSVSRQIEAFQIENFKIHDDINGLLWFGDGVRKNYTKEWEQIGREYEYCGIRISTYISGAEEPSLIYTKQAIRKPSEKILIERPSYYPTFTELTPEQRYIYSKLLTNPYDINIDIGYVFILYYGLERHLLCGDYDSAFKVILKLRDVHKNGSFQSYSANAIILTSMLHNKGEYALAFVDSLDKEYEFNFSSNLFLICYYSFNLPLTPKDIMRMSSTFDFTNRNYIKKNPDVFERCLSEIIQNKYGSEGVLISRFITKTELSKIKIEKHRIFANMSLLDKEIPVPMLSENFKLKKDIFDLLSEAHESAKKTLAEMRKKDKL